LFEKTFASLFESFSRQKYRWLNELVCRALCRRLRLPRRPPGPPGGGELCLRVSADTTYSTSRRNGILCGTGVQPGPAIRQRPLYPSIPLSLDPFPDDVRDNGANCLEDCGQDCGGSNGLSYLTGCGKGESARNLACNSAGSGPNCRSGCAEDSPANSGLDSPADRVRDCPPNDVRGNVVCNLLGDAGSYPPGGGVIFQPQA